MPLPTLSDIDELLNTPGDPCDLGIDPRDVASVTEKLKGTHPWIPYCVVTDWVIMDLICTDEWRQYYSQLGIRPVVLCGYVVEDEQGRGEAGAFIRTSPLKEVIDQHIFLTRSTAYVLSGPGTRKEANAAHVMALSF